MKLKKTKEQMHEMHEKHENAKHLTDNAKRLADKKRSGNFYGHRWFPYSISE